jgi:hypothetical protein
MERLRASAVSAGDLKDVLIQYLPRIKASAAFANSQQLKVLLDYLIAEYLEDRHSKITRTTIAEDAFDDKIDENAVGQAIKRLRFKLGEYYDGDGQADPVRIEVPNGGCVPEVRWTPPALPVLAAVGAESPARTVAPTAPPVSLFKRLQSALIADDQPEWPLRPRTSWGVAARKVALQLASPFWPDVSTKQGARTAIRNGVGLAYAIAVLTIIAAAMGVLPRTAVVDSMIYIAIGLKLRKMSRGASVALLCCFIAEKISLPPKDPGQFTVATVCVLLIVGALRGTWAYNTLRCRELDADRGEQP